MLSALISSELSYPAMQLALQLHILTLLHCHASNKLRCPGRIYLQRTQYMVANKRLQKDFDIGTTHMVLADSHLPAYKGRAMSKSIEKVDRVKNVLGMDVLMGSAIPKEMLPDQLQESLQAGGHQLIMIKGF